MRVLENLANLLYPPVCALCHGSESDAEGTLPERPFFCASCRNKMAPCAAPLCQQCGIAVSGAFDAAIKCRECLSCCRPFSRARAPWQYTGALPQLIHQLKYTQRWKLGNWLAEAMADSARQTIPIERVDWVVPVPAHWLRKRLRGFDSTSYLACQVAKKLNLPCLPKALKRVRWTQSQTRLPWVGRMQNMRGAFRADPLIVSGKTVLLIDDVLTTAATAESSGGALRDAGAREVFVLTAARTPLN